MANIQVQAFKDRSAGTEVQLVNLSKIYQNVKAVDNVNLIIEKGEFLTLLGPSGSGKTTTLSMIAGFQFPTSGDILFNGEPINYLPPEKRNIGMVFQNYALFPHMTVAQNIAFPLEMRKFEKKSIAKEVNKALKIVRLEGYGQRYIKQISGGQAQRVALARAIVYNPTVLLMDEPLGALDKKLREEMQIEIKHIHEELGLTVIYVTHDQQEALTMSDRIALMNNGQIVQLGSPSELYQKPNSKFVGTFLGESNLWEGTISLKNDDLYEVTTLDGVKVRTISTEDFHLNEKVSLLIRPEWPTINDDLVEGQNNLTGTIIETIYMGDFSKYELQLGQETTMVVKTPFVPGQYVCSKGDQVSVSWQYKGGVILKNFDQ